MGRVTTLQVEPRKLVDGWPLLSSPFEGVSNEAWTALYSVLASSNDGVPRAIDYRGVCGALGMFAINPRRLVDVGLATSVRRRGRLTTAVFKLPHAEVKFLSNPLTQREVLVKSLKQYLVSLSLPVGMSRSGALALLHCAGPNGIAEWQRRPLTATTALMRRADGIF